MKLPPSVIGLAFILALWQLIAMAHLISPVYFATPLEVGKAFCDMFFEQTIARDTYATIFRILTSLALTMLIGIPLGVLLGYLHQLYSFVETSIDLLRSVPPIVFYPLFLLILGPTDAARIGVATLGSITVLVFLIAHGLGHQNPFRRKFHQSAGASTLFILRHVVVFEALPHILAGLRTATSLSMIIIVVTEMLVGAQNGLGTRIQNVQITQNIPDLYATILIIGIIGLLFNKVLSKADERLVFWKTS